MEGKTCYSSFDATDKTEAEIKQFYRDSAAQSFSEGLFVPRDKAGNYPEVAYLLVMKQGEGYLIQVVGSGDDVANLIGSILRASHENKILEKALRIAMFNDRIEHLAGKLKDKETTETTAEDLTDKEGTGATT